MRVIVSILLFSALAFGQLPKPGGATGGGTGAPTDAGYWVKTLNGTLSAEVVPPSGIVKSTSGTPSAAEASDVVTLFGGGSCSGYLKSDATCDTPSSGAPTDATFVTLQAEAGLSAESSLGALADNSIVSVDVSAAVATIRAAAHGDVIALFDGGSCSGYLKSDGTCDTPSGSLPSMTGNSNKFLSNNGSTADWRQTGYGIILDATSLRVDPTAIGGLAQANLWTNTNTFSNTVSISGASAKHDASGAGSGTLPVQTGTTPPASCTADKEMFLDTDAPEGPRLLICNSGGNGWILARPAVVELAVFDFTTDTATGDGKYYFTVPANLSGTNLVGVSAQVISAGTTGTLDVDLARCDAVATGNACSGTVQDVLSTNLTIDSGEGKSSTAATPAIIDTTYDDVDEDEILRVDVDGVHSGTAAKGLIVQLEFR